MIHQPQLIPDQPSPDQAAREAERAEYLERLREKLQDPEFRAVEGFPIGEDEDILALSDPPYYTACPNPFLPEIIERWQAERAQLREELGLPDDSADNGNGGQTVYHREPFTTDVSEGKHDPIYKAHTYHTKVPYKAVMRYILHYTDPGDIVFDGFAGTGMTGIAAQMCADPDSEFKNQVESEWEKASHTPSKWGTRRTILADLSPAATFIAYNYNTPVKVDAFEREAKRILDLTTEECGWMYRTKHTDGLSGFVNYFVWSDVFICPHCTNEIVFWEAAFNRKVRKIASRFSCPHCDSEVYKGILDYARESYFDPVLGKTSQRNKQIPVLVSYTVGRKRYTKRPDSEDLDLTRQSDNINCQHWFPVLEMMFKGQEWGCLWRAGYHYGMSHVHHFFSRRNICALAALWDKIQTSPIHLQPFLRFWITSTMIKTSRLMNYNADGIGRVMKGSLYISSLVQEVNPVHFLRISLRDFVSAFRKANYSGEDVRVYTGSASQMLIPTSIVDYIFLDPPFGQNLIYSELNFIWEAWMKVITNSEQEAIVNTAVQKQLTDYQRMMEQCFVEMFRILKPGHWMTIEFHNSQNAVWNSIQEAVLRAGFMIADVRTLDKKHGSIKQVTTTGAVRQDLIISAYKPRSGFERRFLEQAGSEEGAWAFVRQHLEQLPIVVEKDGVLEVVAERQNYLLYDRMVAFHIQRGFSVPLGAAEFYAGLKQRFPERDGMYFLPHQVVEYDKRRLQASQVEQLALFVSDEKSAIQWLRRELDPSTGSGPQTYQDLQPKFLRELHQARHEALPELSDMLAQNLLKDEQDRWYVPDPARQEDLEKLRERSLLREFQEYAQGKGRLKVFRTEAVRAGFKRAWAERDYRLIIRVAQRLPESVLQEDPGLLMYYDNALMRAESEPVQGRLL